MSDPAPTNLKQPRLDPIAPPVAILAGSGSLPIAVAQSIVALGGKVHIVGYIGAADKAIEDYDHYWCNLGGIGAMLRSFHDAGCLELVIAGAVRRPDLKKIRLDLGFLTNLPAALSLLKGGDDDVLSKVIRFFEGHGFVVRGAHEFAPHLVAETGTLGAVKLNSQHWLAIEKAASLIRALGPFDIGQAAIASADGVLALEGSRGTDAMIRDAVANADKTSGAHGALQSAGDRDMAARAGKSWQSVADYCEPPKTSPERGAGASVDLDGAVLVKIPKPGQELRVDMPAIGPVTIDLSNHAGLAGIAIAAGRALMLDRCDLLARADATGLFVEGVEDQPAEVPPGQGTVQRHGSSEFFGSGSRQRLVPLGARRPREQDWSDIELGCRLMDVLGDHSAGHGAVVTSGHVLGVQTLEPIETFLRQVGRNRPWGGFLRRRRGVLVLRARDITDTGWNGSARTGLGKHDLAKNEKTAAICFPQLNLSAMGWVLATNLVGVAFCTGSIKNRRESGISHDLHIDSIVAPELRALAEKEGLFLVGPAKLNDQ